MGREAWSQPAKSAPKPVAVVNGTPITRAELDAVLKQAGPTAAPLTEAQKRQMQVEAVGMLIDDLLMQQFLRKNGPRVELAEVEKQLAELDASLKRQGKTLQDFYKDSGQNDAQLRSNIVTKLQWEGYVKQRITDADVKKFYDDCKDFFDRVTVRASHIVIRVSAKATEKERQEARAKLEALRQEIVGGKLDFAEAAKKHSQCQSAPNGGDIGYFPRKMAVEEAFGKAAFALKVGEVSDVVQTDYGVHLIKVTDRKPGQPSEFNKIKDEVREMYVSEMWLNVLGDLRKTAQVDVNLD
jgi:peptidyl-prolyl cis-trans isomerase C